MPTYAEMIVLSAVLSRPRRRGQGSFKRPPFFKAMAQVVARNADASRPVGQAHRFAIQCQAMISLGISRLFGRCCPAAIVWRVRTVAIEAFNTMRRGRLEAHIGEKASEIGAPFFADRNPMATVQVIHRRFRIGAALNHVRPRRVLTAFGHPVAIGQASNPFAAETATAWTGPAPQIAECHKPACAAIARAIDATVTIWRRGPFGCDQPSS